MPSSCAVENCNDRYASSAVSFHKFPFKRKDLLQKWMDFVAREPNWQPSKWSSVCSRHFCKEDFKWTTERKTLKKTAVPSVRRCISAPCEPKKPLHVKEAAAAAAETASRTSAQAEANEKQDEDDATATTLDELAALHDGSSLPNALKVNCRLCGAASAAIVTFGSNFEMFGLIQKCLPTLNIQQDDQLPKDMCRVCLKRLENFSCYIDKVLETQTELQRKYRTTEGSSSHSNNSSSSSRVVVTAPAAVERQLKIKQEPVAVRVKQEIAEGFESFLSSDDMDMPDDACEPPDRPPTTEQKFHFCDFPMLNTQDIINNCDIMEIINLDDPFINIPDDDANTMGGGSVGGGGEEQTPAEADTSLLEQQLPPPTPQLPMPQRQQLPSAHELLQTHLLIEEHNYANAAEDFKEEWQIKNFYKTEKTEEGYEQDEGVAEHEEEYAHEECEMSSAVVCPSDIEAFKSLSAPEYTNSAHVFENRSAKPIVTSESRLQFATGKLLIPGVGFGGGGVFQKNYTPPHTKPNIVVLNESIVKSSSPFQLHACSVCQLKFFSLESLSQHCQMAHKHQDEPMVSVPSANILAHDIVAAAVEVVTADTVVRNCKIEAGCEKEGNSGVVTHQIVPPIETQTHLNPAEWHTQPPYRHEMVKIDPFSNTSAYSSPPSRAAKRQINILEMRQTFFPNLIAENSVATATQTQHNETVFKVPNKPAPMAAASSLKRQRDRKPNAKIVAKTGGGQLPKTAAAGAKTNSTTKQTLTPHAHVAAATTKNVFENYKQLRKRFRQLQRKCKSLQQNVAAANNTKMPQTPAPVSPTKSLPAQFQCRTCRQKFTTIYALLRHKQTASSHHVPKPRTQFASTCSGCEKFFRSKLALRNHMRYICPTLSLRCLRQLHIQTFKCRCCRRITFTHWRLYRRHELRCKQKQQQRRRQPRRQHQQPSKTRPRKPKCSNQAASTTKPAPRQQLQHLCPICPKSFASSNSLNQHRITHCSERLFKCNLCVRIFKRRNGLAQHMNGFHLQLKPYACSVCAHSYALKCDMLRCRHSTLRSATSKRPVFPK